MITIDNRKLKEWEQVPNIWKKYDNPKKLKNLVFKDIEYEEFEYIFEPFTANDVFRPAMNGVNVDENYIVSTDAHCLITYPNLGRIQNGIYNFKNDGILKKYEKINATNYPNYLVVIPDETKYQYRITIKLLRTYLAIIENGQYANELFQAVSFKVYGLEYNKITLNLKYLIKILDTFSSFGKEEIWFGFNGTTKSVIISYSRFDVTFPTQGMKYNLMCIIQPIYEKYDNFGTIDIDFDTECGIYYNFEIDCIIDMYGEIYSNGFSSYYIESLPPANYNIKEDEFKQLSNVTKTNKNLPEFKDVLVNDDILYARSITYDCFFVIPNVGINNGFFQIVNGALKDIDSSLNKWRDFIYVLENNNGITYSHDIKKVNANQFIKSYSDAVLCKLSNNDTPADDIDIQIYGEENWEYFCLQYGSNSTHNHIFYNKAIDINTVGLYNEIKYTIPESIFTYSIIQHFNKDNYLFINCNKYCFEILSDVGCKLIIFKKDNNFNDLSFISQFPYSNKLGFEDKIEDFTKAELKLLKDTVANNIKWNKKNKYSDITEQIGIEKYFELSFSKISVEKKTIQNKELILKKQIDKVYNFDNKFINFLLIEKNGDYGIYNSQNVYNSKSFKAFLEISNMKNVFFNSNYMTIKLVDEERKTTKTPKPPKPPKPPKTPKTPKVTSTPTTPSTTTPKVLTKEDYERRIKGIEALLMFISEQTEIEKLNRKLNGLKALLKYS